jgi:predicted AlkP superfamily pyrophosphatase or phosphodiesterase
MPFTRCRAALAVLMALLPALACAASPAPEPSAPAPSRPRLVLAVSVDQLRADTLTRFRDQFTGGFKRLLEAGALFTQARYRHACTETGPGHSVILSGRSPRHSGVVANSWWDDALRRRVNVVDDPSVVVLGGEGRAASPAHFHGFTLGDALKKATSRARVVGVSFKDRAAILMSGPRADGAYWFGSAGGRFVTSSYYGPAAPGWLERWNARRPADAYAGRAWERLLPDPALYDRLAGPDAVDGEADRKDIVFPHRPPAAPPAREYYDFLWRTPFADDLVLDLALEAQQQHELGLRDVTDLLAVGFSATDVIGHNYGPDSHEALDQALRLDLLLARLLDALETRVGAGRVLVVLTADHGVQPLVEVARARGLATARRVSSDIFGKQALNAALAPVFPGAVDLVVDADETGVTFDLGAAAARGLKRGDVEQAAARALLASGHVARVYTHADLMGDAPPDDPFFPLYRRAFYAPRTPHLVLRLHEGVYVDNRPGGTGHGGPYDVERHVPIVFMGPGVERGTHAIACGPEDIAWSLAKLLGIDYPQQDAEVDLAALMTTKK